MPLFDYDKELLQKLKESPFERQEEVGDPPASWAKEMGLETGYYLPDRSLTRSEVRKICSDPEQDQLLGYLCAMACGGTVTMTAKICPTCRGEYR